MKYYSIILIFAALNCQGQDTAKHLSKSSISFTAGTNIVYPGTKQVINNTTIGPNPYWEMPVWNLTITPTTSASSYFSLNYSYNFHSNAHFHYSITAGFTYLRYSYQMNAHGYFYTGSYDSGTFKAQTNINACELNIGMSADYKITHKLSWHNELSIIEGYYNNSSFSVSTNAPTSAPFEQAINPYGYYTINNMYTYLFYKTGLNISLSENISLMPELTLPLLNLLFLSENKEPYNYTLPAFPAGEDQPLYRSLRTGITLTYNFNKT